MTRVRISCSRHIVHEHELHEGSRTHHVFSGREEGTRREEQHHNKTACLLIQQCITLHVYDYRTMIDSTINVDKVCLVRCPWKGFITPGESSQHALFMWIIFMMVLNVSVLLERKDRSRHCIDALRSKVRTNMMTGWMWAAMPLIMLLMLALLAIFVWAIVWVTMHWMNKNRTNTPTMRNVPPQDFSQRYEQGYQPPEPGSETYQEGGKPYHYPQPQQEQPQAQYPQEQEMPRQH